MSRLRAGIAAPLLALWRLGHRPALGEFRILILHDVPMAWLGAFEAMVARLAADDRLLTPLEAEAMLAGIAARPRKGRSPCLLSFDDGFASNLEAAAILERHGGRGLFFLCPGLMELPPQAQRDAIATRIFDGKRPTLPHQRLMSWEEAAGLAARGHRIGSHSLTHQRLTTLDGPALEQEIGAAAGLLRQRLGTVAEWFATPFGDIASIGADALAVIARHHRWCRSGIRGPNTPATKPLAVLADSIDLAMPRAWQDLAAEGGLDFRYNAARQVLEGLVDHARA